MKSLEDAQRVIEMRKDNLFFFFKKTKNKTVTYFLDLCTKNNLPPNIMKVCKSNVNIDFFIT